MGGEQTGGRGPGGRESSDLFQVGGGKRAIPTIGVIPKTKEEVRRQRILWAARAVGAAIFAILATWGAIRFLQNRRIETARLEFERDGRPASLANAIGLLDGTDVPGNIALLARLHATAALEGMDDAGLAHRTAAEQLLQSHDPNDSPSDHLIAQTYLALARGDAASAGTSASGLRPSGPRAAEAGRARALAALAIGNSEQALAAAQAAVRELEGSPRHLALLGVTAARAGQATPIEGDALPLRLARGRVQWDAGEGREALGTEMARVAADETATPAERAWAQLLVGLSAIARGDTRPATEAVTAAAQTPPPGDEPFRVATMEAWLALGRTGEARAIADALPGISSDASRRAQALAELLILEGQGGPAEAALAHAAPGPRTSRLAGSIARLRGQHDVARTKFEEAAQAPSERLAATLDLTGALVDAGRATDAVARVAPLLEQSATHPRVAAAAARAYAAAGDRARGLQLIDAALAAHDHEPLLLAAKGRVHLAAEEWQPALEALRAAAEIDPRDAALQTDRGRAAKRVGRNDEALQAFTAAVEADPRSEVALVALLGAQLDANDTTAAETTLQRVDTARLSTLEIEQLRARWLVDTQAGAAGLEAVRRARRNARRDRPLAYAHGRLAMQAERWYDAIDAFQDATPNDAGPERRDVTLWRTLALAHLRRTDAVEQQVEAVRESAEAFPLTPDDEARLLAAEAWAAWTDEAYARAMSLAPRALAADANNSDGLVLAAMSDERNHRDPAPRLRAAMEGHPPSIEAAARLALLPATPDAERCALAQRYLSAAPEGAQAAALRERTAACPR